MSMKRRGRRLGGALLEVLIALAILGGSLLGMAEYGRRYARTNANSFLLSNSLDLAAARVERVKSERNYTSMDTLAGTQNGVLVGTDSRYRVVTAITRTQTSQLDYKTVTVTVTHPAMSSPVRKTSAIARF
jgi:Tfp pilus assembly protein PilV